MYNFPNGKKYTLLNLISSVLSKFDIILLLCTEKKLPYLKHSKCIFSKTKPLLK